MDGFLCFVIIFAFCVSVFIGVGIGTVIDFDWKEFFKYRLEKEKMQLFSDTKYKQGENEHDGE